MGTRIIKKEKQRKLSIMLTPFIPCSAKLPLISLFSSYFFREYSGLVAASVYFLSILIIIISSIIINKLFIKERKNDYIFELPDYKKPNFKYMLKDVLDRVKDFIKRAGTIILFCSIIIWFLLSFSPNLCYGIEVEFSILAFLGKKIAWLFYPILGTYS